ncbi:MAG: ThiF family adenylyltransferase [Hyphomonas sp.]|nr:ThiF family adenylyltransferase [Hyphomonas sp.]
MTVQKGFSAVRTELANTLGTFLISEYGAKALSKADLKLYHRHGVDYGWHLPGKPPLRLLLDRAFPYQAPRIALGDETFLLVWPHVERLGLLCVYPAETNIDALSPNQVAAHLIEEARVLVARNKLENHDAAFRAEFQSYWSLATDKNAPIYRSLVRPHGPTRRIRVWRGQSKTSLVRVFGETDEVLCSWLDNANGPSPDEGWKFDDAVLVWLDEPLVPDAYPANASDVEALIRQSAGSERDYGPLLDVSQTADLLIGAPVETGACFGAVYLERPDQKKLQKGFRPGRIPTAHSKRYATSPARQAKKAIVDRVDPAWVHGRDHNRDIEQLGSASALIIGCGALGASVAVLLAQAGLGHFTLYDGQYLDRTNTSRHPLGANHVDQNKAKALAKHLTKRFPHMRGVDDHDAHVDIGVIEKLPGLDSADLVISATGEWASMSLIADAGRSWEIPLQTIWHEPQALAAHSVLTLPNGPCLRCGFNHLGKPLLEATLQDESAVWRQIPACGGAFTPYGAAQLAFTSGFCASEALKNLTATPAGARHSIWVASDEDLAAGAAERSAAFKSEFDTGLHGARVSRPWTLGPECPLCSSHA